MIIQGLTLDGGFKLDPPVAPTPAGPSKIVVGACNDDDPSNSGSAYIYNIDGTGEVKITASDGASGDNFGFSVAMSDTKIVVGAPNDDDSGSNSGSAYVYNTDGTGEVKITASDGTASDTFGDSVAMTDTKIVVGAKSAGNKGAVYVYNTDGTGEVKITSSDGASGDQFGISVAISDTKIVVGANGDDDNNSMSGSAYVYNLDGTGEVKITASDHAAGDFFGWRVALSDTKIVVGSINDDDAGDNSGSVYVYNTDGTGELKITASDHAAGDRFGYSVAISDTHIVVGSQMDDDAGDNSGSVYVYNLDGTGEQKIIASDGAANDRFGFSVAIQGDKIIVGAMLKEGVGAAYIYNLDGTGEVKITASDGASGDQFGRSVALN